jgi:hypothetical protein
MPQRERVETYENKNIKIISLIIQFMKTSALSYFTLNSKLKDEPEGYLFLRMKG